MISIKPRSIDDLKLAVTDTATLLYTLVDTASSNPGSQSYYNSADAASNRDVVNAISLRAEDGDIRISIGATPTASKGFLVKQGTRYFFHGDVSLVQLIRTGGSNVAVEVGFWCAQRGEVINGNTDTVSITGGDIELGAVEIKNGTDDTRATVTAANTARTVATTVVSVQEVGADGTVPPTGSTHSNAPFVKLTDGTTDVSVIATINSLKSDVSSIGAEALVADNAPGTSVTKTLPVGGKYNASAPTYTDGDVVMVQADINGNLKVTERATIPQAYGTDATGQDAYATVVTANAERHHIQITNTGTVNDAIVSIDGGVTDNFYILAGTSFVFDNVLIANGATIQAKNASAGNNYTGLYITVW